RFASATDLSEELERWLADEPVNTFREPAPVRARRWARKHPARVAATAATILAFLLASAIGGWSDQRQKTRHEKTASALCLERALKEAGVDRILERLPELWQRALWKQAEASLAEAEDMLGADGDPERLARVREARRNTAFIKTLDEIRQER